MCHGGRVADARGPLYGKGFTGLVVS
jgi:hypothetical protein